MTTAVRIKKKVRATQFRAAYRRLAAQAQGRDLVLIENRRQKSKYLVDKDFLDALLDELRGARATLEILSDPELTERLLALGASVDRAVRARRLRTYSMAEVFARP